MFAQTDISLSAATAGIIKDAFDAYHAKFKEITRGAKERFEQRDWHGLHDDTQKRLELYREFVAGAVGAVKQSLPEHAGDQTFWPEVKKGYMQLVAGTHECDVAESFYNSVTMRVVETTGIDPEIQFTGPEPANSVAEPDDPVFKCYPYSDTNSTQELVRNLLLDCCFTSDYQDLERSTQTVAGQIDARLQETGAKAQSIDLAEPIFYRGKAAYRVGRISTTAAFIPFTLALLNDDDGIHVDAVLLTEDEVSIVFSFARSYFHVELENPRAMVHFLKSIMPLKPVAELYISLGYNKHGKTELYRDLMRHMRGSSDQFEIARGDRGMVMTVFTLASYDVVFKIIKDTFDYPKTTTRQDVRNRYYLVFKHDRGGRLVDAQEFEHLRFEKARFSPSLLEELLRVAAKTVSVDGDYVVIDHLYTERRLVPLNLHLREVDGETAAEAVIDYGQTIKDLAATNIFPGDILLKNFGVTRHGRIVFYDYDELCLLTDCVFRKIPEAEDPFDEMSAEPWFSVSERDVFPEELSTFLGLGGALREVFIEHHGDLFDVEFWSGLQERHKAGEVIEILPYKERNRLPKQV